jgi:hypothetical protein
MQNLVLCRFGPSQIRATKHGRGSFVVSVSSFRLDYSRASLYKIMPRPTEQECVFSGQGQQTRQWQSALFVVLRLTGSRAQQTDGGGASQWPMRRRKRTRQDSWVGLGSFAARDVRPPSACIEPCGGTPALRPCGGVDGTARQDNRRGKILRSPTSVVGVQLQWATVPVGIQCFH